MNTYSLFRNLIFILWISLFTISKTAFGCTIMSGIAENGHVWNANNEDGPFGVANFINVFLKKENSKYGYYTLSYFSPAFGNGGKMQGGMNEAGLTFDFATIEPTNLTNTKNKKAFPAGDAAILPHILANMGSTAEVIDFFETYWFENGFVGAQMHVADRNGRFAIISPSGIKLVENGQPLVTTNFDICGEASGSTCWRFSIATGLLNSQSTSLEIMQALCKATAQKTGGTMYSNIQNLTTGEIWFSSKHDPVKTVIIKLSELLYRGERSYTFSNLDAVKSVANECLNIKEPKAITLTENQLTKYSGTYSNWATGEISITIEENGIIMTSQFMPAEILLAATEDTFFIPDAGIKVIFATDKVSGKRTLNLYENGYWSFTVWEETE